MQTRANPSCFGSDDQLSLKSRSSVHSVQELFAFFEFRVPDVTAPTNLSKLPRQLMIILGHLNPAHE